MSNNNENFFCQSSELSFAPFKYHWYLFHFLLNSIFSSHSYSGRHWAMSKSSQTLFTESHNTNCLCHSIHVHLFYFFNLKKQIIRWRSVGYPKCRLCFKQQHCSMQSDVRALSLSLSFSPSLSLFLSPSLCLSIFFLLLQRFFLQPSKSRACL